MMKITSAIILVLWCTGLATAQQTIPPQPYRPEEMVSFNRNVPFNTALEILNGYSQRFENRLLIDSKVRTNPIGVSVENMHWKRALEYILRANLLKYEVHERHYEVKQMVDGKEPEPEQDPVDIWTREVEINAVFFQADYEALHEMGIDWSTFKNGTVRVQTFGASNVSRDFLRASYNGTLQGTTVNVAALLRLFESKSKGEILARPQIRVLDGEKGKIKVGKNFYLALQDFAGNTRFTEYEAGVILTVTPTLYGRRDSTFIHLDIQAERSDVVPDAFGPTKSTTEGATRVLLLNGEETVLAGLVSYEKSNLRRGLPILKDLPLFRYLFGYNASTLRKKELVILIEARVVPSLLARKNAPPMGLNRQLEKQRQEFKRLQQEIENNGNRRSTTRATGRTSQAKP